MKKKTGMAMMIITFKTYDAIIIFVFPLLILYRRKDVAALNTIDKLTISILLRKFVPGMRRNADNNNIKNNTVGNAMKNHKINCRIVFVFSFIADLFATKFKCFITCSKAKIRNRPFCSLSHQYTNSFFSRTFISPRLPSLQNLTLAPLNSGP